jgi:hypothetical protein
MGGERWVVVTASEEQVFSHDPGRLSGDSEVAVVEPGIPLGSARESGCPNIAV